MNTTAAPVTSDVVDALADLGTPDALTLAGMIRRAGVWEVIERDDKRDPGVTRTLAGVSWDDGVTTVRVTPTPTPYRDAYRWHRATVDGRVVILARDPHRSHRWAVLTAAPTPTH